MKKKRMVAVIIFFSVIFLAVCVLVFFLFFKNRVQLAPVFPEKCRIDEDCTKCASDVVITFGRCVQGVCSDARLSRCESARAGWKSACVNPNDAIAYCFSSEK